MLMIKKKKYSNYTKSELIEELHIMIDNCNAMEWRLENQAKYINQNYIPIEWLKEYEAKNGQEVRLQSAIEEWEKENGKVD